MIHRSGRLVREKKSGRNRQISPNFVFSYSSINDFSPVALAFGHPRFLFVAFLLITKNQPKSEKENHIVWSVV